MNILKFILLILPGFVALAICEIFEDKWGL